MVFMMARQGGWTNVRQWPKTLQTKLYLNGAIRLEFTQIRWFLLWPGREAEPGDQWPQMLMGKPISNLRQSRDLLKREELQL
jgi:hypothetical protein